MESAGITVAQGHGEWHPSYSPFPVLRVQGDGTLLHANEASDPLLRDWGVTVGDSLPEDWPSLVRRVLAEREIFETERPVDGRLFLLTIVPAPEQDCVFIHGYDATRRLKDIHQLEEREGLFRQALHDSESRMQSLQENIPLGLYRSTRDGSIIYANQAMARMLGYDSTGDLCRESTQTFYADSADRERVLSVLEKHGLVKDWEVRLKRRDGSVIDCALNIRAVYDDEHRLVLQDGIVSDITDRKRIQEALLRAKEQAEEANRIKSNFLATMSHELRTPLNGILGFANLLAEALGDNHQLREMAEIIHLSGHRLLDTLNSILDLSIVEAGRLSVQPERVDVANVVRESAMLYAASARSKGLELRSSLPDPALEVVTDERLLRQILNNLINNAIKYTWEGSVTLVAEPVSDAANEAVRIHIADTGIGISQKDQQVIFDEFRQASEGYSRAYDGTGLGLSVSQKFAHVLGGRISLVSVPGKGSCFTLHLPGKNL